MKRKRDVDKSNHDLKRQSLRFLNRFRKLVDGKSYASLPHGKVGNPNECVIARGVNYGIEVQGPDFKILVSKRLGKRRSLTIVNALGKAGGFDLCTHFSQFHRDEFGPKSIEKPISDIGLDDLAWGDSIYVRAPGYIEELVLRFDEERLPDLVI